MKLINIYSTLITSLLILAMPAYYASQGLCICWASVCRFAAVGPADRRYRSISARHMATRRANPGSATLSAYA